MAVALVMMAAAAATAPLVPVGKWTVKYAEDRCTVDRSYGQAERPTILALLPSPLGRGLEVRVSEPDPSYVMKVATGTVTLSPSGRTAKIELTSFGPTTDSRRVTSFALPDVPLDDLVLADQLLVDRGRAGPSLAIAPGGSPTLLAPVTKCQDDLLGHYGVDVAAMHRRSRLPQPIVAEAKWFRRADYPKEALKNFRGGRAVAHTTIGADGQVSDCKVVVSANSPDLDARTCAVLRERGRYEPGLDADGRPTTSSRLVAVAWAWFAAR